MSITVVQCNCGEESESGVHRADPDEHLELLLLSFLALLLFIFYLFVLGELEWVKYSKNVTVEVLYTNNCIT